MHRRLSAHILVKKYLINTTFTSRKVFHTNPPPGGFFLLLNRTNKFNRFDNNVQEEQL